MAMIKFEDVEFNEAWFELKISTLMYVGKTKKENFRYEVTSDSGNYTIISSSELNPGDEVIASWIDREKRLLWVDEN